MGFFRDPYFFMMCEIKKSQKSWKNPEWKFERHLFIIERTFWCQILGLMKLKKNEIRKNFWILTVFWPSGFFGISWESPGLGFFSLGIFISKIRDFSKFWDLYPRDSRKIRGNRDFFGISYLRNIPRSGYFTFGISRRFFILGIGIFFVGWDIPTKSQLCL